MPPDLNLAVDPCAYESKTRSDRVDPTECVFIEIHQLPNEKSNESKDECLDCYDFSCNNRPIGTRIIGLPDG